MAVGGQSHFKSELLLKALNGLIMPTHIFALTMSQDYPST